MNNRHAKVTKNRIEQYILSLIPENQRRIASRVNLTEIVQRILYKLKTSVQWKCLFIEIESFGSPFSRQPAYDYYREWCKTGVFKQIFEVYSHIQEEKPDTENLNLDCTHSFVKKSGESVWYQHCKRRKQAMFW